MAQVSSTVTLDDGRKFPGCIYRISGTKLGRDLDHLSFVAHVELDGGGIQTAMAPLMGPLDEYNPMVQEHISKILEVVGVEFWEQLKGEHVIGLSEGEGMATTIVGFASLDGERTYIYKDLLAPAAT